MSPFFCSDESVKSVINYSISVDSVCSVDYLFSTEDTEGHGGGLTKTIVHWRACCVRKRTGQQQLSAMFHQILWHRRESRQGGLKMMVDKGIMQRIGSDKGGH